MYTKEHSVEFVDETTGYSRNSWYNWWLIPKSRPVVNPPAVKTSMTDILGGNGQLDFSETLTGYPTYNNSTGTWTFMVDNDRAYDRDELGYRWVLGKNGIDWFTLYSYIKAFIHNRKMRVTLRDDPSWYYEGRISVGSWDSGQQNSEVQISYNFLPGKKRKWSTMSDFIWDDFNFTTDVDYSVSNNSLSFDCSGSSKVAAIPVEDIVNCQSRAQYPSSPDPTKYYYIRSEELILHNGEVYASNDPNDESAIYSVTTGDISMDVGNMPTRPKVIVTLPEGYSDAAGTQWFEIKFNITCVLTGNTTETRIIRRSMCIVPQYGSPVPTYEFELDHPLIGLCYHPYASNQAVPWFNPAGTQGFDMPPWTEGKDYKDGYKGLITIKVESMMPCHIAFDYVVEVL